MTTAPAWSLTDAEAVTSSIDLARTVGVLVGVPAIVLAINEADDPARWQRALRSWPSPVVTIAAGGGIADAEGDIDALVDAVLNRPHAATVAALLGRHLPADPVEAFHAESLAYATLQAGPEHAAWLAMRGRRVRRDDAPRVRLDGTEPVVLTPSPGRDCTTARPSGSTSSRMRFERSLCSMRTSRSTGQQRDRRSVREATRPSSVRSPTRPRPT